MRARCDSETIAAVRKMAERTGRTPSDAVRETVPTITAAELLEKAGSR